MKLFPQKFTLTIAATLWFAVVLGMVALQYVNSLAGRAQRLFALPSFRRRIARRLETSNGWTAANSCKIDADSAKKSKELPICGTCNQPDYCRAQAECHYTGSPMFNPDGSINRKE